MPDEESPDPEQLTADQAFADSENIVFMGRSLSPFSIRRQIAAQACGHRLLSGKVKLNPDTPSYDGLFLDMALVLWLCDSPDATVAMAATRPEQSVADAMDWAEAAGMSIGSRAFEEAGALHIRIMLQLAASKFRVVEQDDKKKAGAGAVPSPTDG